MNKPLYDLADEFQALAQLLINEPDMPNEIIDDILDAHTGGIKSKAWNIAAMILQFDGEAGIVRAAEKRMKVRRKTLETRADWLRGYLLDLLIHSGVDELPSPEFVASVSDRRPRLVLDDENVIPDEFKKEETVVTIRTKKLLEVMIDGASITGAHLEQRKRLRIR